MDPIPNLMKAAREGNINGLYQLITDNPTVLKEIDKKPLVTTPLHEAASAGQTDFAIEMMNLAPSFGRKLNPDGLSPLDLALQKNHKDTVKRLVSFDGELVRVKGKDRLTPLHRAAESDDKILCLIELLLACPDSIKDLTIRDETALHIAMKSSSGAEAFKILHEWVSRAGDGHHKQLLRKKDADGKSAEAYHKKLQPQDRKSLCCVKAEKPSAPDDDTKKLYDYLRTPEPWFESIIRGCLQFMLWTQRGLTMKMRGVVLVVAVLIATGSFQAILTPPDREEREWYEQLYTCFYLLNTIAFNASVGAIMMVLRLRSYTCILHLSLIFMIACYWFAVYKIISPSGLLALFFVAVLFIGSSVYILLVYYLKLLFWTMEARKPDLLAKLLFLHCFKQKFRCLNQMGALTLE